MTANVVIIGILFGLIGTVSKRADFTQSDAEKNKIEKYSVAYVTVPNIEVGKKLAHGLVKGRLAACVNIVPQITSIYEWKGEINQDTEALLMIKTRTSEVDRLTQFVSVNHPYEVCEVISLPIMNGNPPYLKWIGDSVPQSEKDSDGKFKVRF